MHAPADYERFAVIVKKRKIRRIVIVGITVLIILGWICSLLPLKWWKYGNESMTLAAGILLRQFFGDSWGGFLQ